MAASLTLWQRVEHSARIHSVAGVVFGLIDTGGRRVLGPSRWRLGPWYAARIGGVLKRPVRIDGATIQLPDGVSPFLVGALRLQRYEGMERYAIAKFLPRDVPVIELGGGVGVVACLIDRLLRDGRQHWVVEANPVLIPILKQTRAANHGHFHVLHGALGYDRKMVEFGIDDETVTMSAVATGNSRATTVVPTLTLAEILRRTGFEHCSLVCDIEGAEADLISREALLMSQSIGTIVMEVHPDVLGLERVEALHRELDARGFGLLWSLGNVWVLRRRS